MFGYITIHQDELRIKDFHQYKRFYCGVCQDLKQRTGQMSRFSLTYDMTFLAILLTAVYEEKNSEEQHACGAHFFRKRECLRNACTAYGADMNVLLTYHNYMDNWLDERKLSGRLWAGVLKRAYQKTAKQYPRQVAAIETYLKDLHETERSGSCDVDRAAGQTGYLMAEIFDFREDVWSEYLRKIGFFLGKFIYLMDAFEDVEKDRKTGNYNPFADMAEEEFQKKVYNILVMQAAEAARAFEKLPVLEYVDILRNVLYDGIWLKYRKICCKEKDKKCGKSRREYR